MGITPVGIAPLRCAPTGYIAEIGVTMPWRHRLRLLRRGAWYALAAMLVPGAFAVAQGALVVGVVVSQTGAHADLAAGLSKKKQAALGRPAHRRARGRPVATPGRL